MAYTPTIWNENDIITAEKLNNIENGISDLDNVLDLGEINWSEFVENKYEKVIDATTYSKSTFAKTVKVSITYWKMEDYLTLDYTFNLSRTCSVDGSLYGADEQVFTSFYKLFDHSNTFKVIFCKFSNGPEYQEYTLSIEVCDVNVASIEQSTT